MSKLCDICLYALGLILVWKRKTCKYVSFEQSYRKSSVFVLFFSFYLVFYLFYFLAVLGLRCCAWAFSSCGERGLLFIAVCGLLIAVASLVVEHGLQAHGLQQLQHVGSVVVVHGLQGAQAQQLWRMGLVAPWHVGSSQSRDQTHVPCIDRRILNHCTTREVPRKSSFLMLKAEMS